jgi:hypothetical protein
MERFLEEKTGQGEKKIGLTRQKRTSPFSRGT